MTCCWLLLAISGADMSGQRRLAALVAELLPDEVELDLIELAEVMLHASESRQESRGSMQRLDFPERDDEHFLAHSMVADDGSVSFKPVHITDYPPKKREY